jgi:hypothetical protein
MTTLIPKFQQTGAGAVNRPINEKLREFVSVMDFIPSGTNTATADCAAYVQSAVTYCLTNLKDLLIPQKIYLASSVNIDRLVDTQDDIFTIYGNSADAGFYTDQAISLFNSSLPLQFGGTTPPSEFIRFENIRFSASANTVDCFVLNGDKFLRMYFNNCYFFRIRMLYSAVFVQSFYISGCTMLDVKGCFLKVVVGAPGAGGGGLYDSHWTDNCFEVSDLTDSQCIDVQQQMVGGSLIGNLFESWGGPVLKVDRANGISVSGNYHEGIQSAACYKMGSTYTASFTGNFFDQAGPVIDCETSWTIVGCGNMCNGSLYKSGSMQTTNALVAAGFYETASKGLISIGDVAYAGQIYDVAPPYLNYFNILQAATEKLGINDFSVGNVTQLVQKYVTDGVSGVTPTGGLNVYSVPGFRSSIKLNYFTFDAASGESTAPSFGIGSSGIFPLQAATASAPTYQKGALYFDTTLNKLRVGGAAGWETVTSV